MKGDKKITLTEKELPTHWYNIVAGTRFVQNLASDSASQSLWTGKSPGYPGQDLFQKRKYQYGRIT